MKINKKLVISISSALLVLIILITSIIVVKFSHKDPTAENPDPTDHKPEQTQQIPQESEIPQDVLEILNQPAPDELKQKIEEDIEAWENSGNFELLEELEDGRFSIVDTETGAI